MDTVANRLTLARIAAIPVLAALLYIDGARAAWASLAVFALAALTDWFDGWVARRWGQTSDIGRFLDPIADKLLVAAMILVMVARHRIDGWWVLPAAIILCREIMVSGLREFLAGLRIGLPVTRLAKWKTTVQMVALALLIIGDDGPAGWPTRQVGEIGLALAATLTLITGYDYLRAGLRHMRAIPRAPLPAGKPARSPS